MIRSFTFEKSSENDNLVVLVKNGVHKCPTESKHSSVTGFFICKDIFCFMK